MRPQHENIDERGDDQSDRVSAALTRISRGAGRIAETYPMTDRRNRGAPHENSALYYNTLLRAENLSMGARRRPGSIDREVAAYAAESRYAWETRRRPGYASVEAGRPFEAEARLIRCKDDPEATKVEAVTKPPPKPTYEEMRAQRDDYPDKPQAVREYEKRKREQRRARRGQKGSGRKN